MTEAKLDKLLIGTILGVFMLIGAVYCTLNTKTKITIQPEKTTSIERQQLEASTKSLIEHYGSGKEDPQQAAKRVADEAQRQGFIP